MAERAIETEGQIYKQEPRVTHMNKITIEVDQTGVVSVDADISDMPFVSLIGPALLDFHNVFARTMNEAADKLQGIAVSAD